jgi:hypothetical protein
MGNHLESLFEKTWKIKSGFFNHPACPSLGLGIAIGKSIIFVLNYPHFLMIMPDPKGENTNDSFYYLI